ncbi:MAG: restriction endonuclease [Phormidium sp. BM_Day4_Bin.17]|nr:restriction endonuclease [Phormidium sp. BM_Day4_Bin.17]UCJ11715.1 MAG: restriction endonuclease [Phormidium sp. PBR-2020]
MSTKSIKDDLLILNSAENKVLEVQEFINQAKELIAESKCIDIEETRNRCIKEATLLPIIGNYTPSFSSLEASSNNLILDLDQQLDAVQKILEEYSSIIYTKRMEITPPFLLDIIEGIEDLLARLQDIYLGKNLPSSQKIEDSSLPKLREQVSDIKTCFGKSISQPQRWTDLNRHLAFGEIHDLDDIVNRDWPSVRQGILRSFFGLRDIDSLDGESISEFRSLVKYVANQNQFSWKELSSEEFERLIFQLVSSPDITYENAEFLMQTNAPDCGRDISVWRVCQDSLFGSIRHRVIIQCKHWLDKSLSVKDISYLKDQLQLWEPPRVDVLIIATTGYFSSDSVRFMENHNQSSSALRIEYWPIEKIKKIVESRPYLLEKFKV